MEPLIHTCQNKYKSVSLDRATEILHCSILYSTKNNTFITHKSSELSAVSVNIWESISTAVYWDDTPNEMYGVK